MGGAIGTVTMHQLNCLPDVIDKEMFRILTKNTFAKEAYDIFADLEGQISAKRMRELAMERDIVLSFEWGIDTKGRSCVRRAQKITDFLSSKGLFIANDDDQNYFMSSGSYGSNKISTRDRVREKMQRAQVMLLIFTQRYFTKYNESEENILRIEFDEFVLKRGARMILPVIFEEEGRVPTSHMLFPLFQHRQCISLTNFESDPSQLQQLYEAITLTITPLREGGDFRERKNVFLESRLGRYYTWLSTHLPPSSSCPPDQLMHYAQILVDEQFDSIARLMQIVMHDEGYLQRVGFRAEHALQVAKAVRIEVGENFDSIRCATITGIMIKQNAAIAEKQQQSLEKITKMRDAAERESEGGMMGGEDMQAFTLRAAYMEGTKKEEWEEKLRRIQEENHNQRRDWEFQLQLFQEAVQQAADREESEKWRAEVVAILSSESVEILADKFRLVLSDVLENELITETAAADGGEAGMLLGEGSFLQIGEASSVGYGLDTRSSVASIQGIFGTISPTRLGSMSAPALTDGSDSNGYIHQFDANGTLVLTSKKHRVLGKGSSADLSVKGGKLFTRTSTVFDHALSPPSPTASSPLVRYGSMNNKPLAIVCKFPILKDPTNMLNALQKACVVCKRIQTLANLQGLPFVQTLLEQGIPRSLVVFLSRSFIYQCHFMEIQLPSQSLYTMTVLCMPQIDEATIHNALIFLLNQMGAMEICISIIKYYIDNLDIVAHALGALYALMSTNDAHTMMLTSTHTKHYSQVFSDDSSSLMLLALCVEQYIEQSSAVVLYVCGVFSKLIRARCVEEKLRGARCLYVFRRLHDVLKTHSETAGCHLPKRELLCLYNTIEDLYFSAKYAHIPLPAPTPYSELPDRTLQQDAIIQIDEHTLLPFLVSQLTLYAESPPLVTPALRTLGNMCFERHDIQRRLGEIETHFPREMMRILKHYHKFVRLGSREERLQGVRVLPEALLTLANSIYTIGDLDGSPVPQPSSPSKTPRSNKGTISSWDKLMRHYLAEGLGEVVCELFDHAHLSNPLLYSLLILLTKMIQRGNSLCTQRLVALGLCDKVGLFLDMNPRMSRPLYEVSCQLLLGLCQSDDILVNASKRIIEKTRCEHWLVAHMRELCRAKQSGGHWSHLYSYGIQSVLKQGTQLVCRTCGLTARLAYQLCCHPVKGEDMKKRLKTAGLLQLMHSRPIDNTYGLEPLLKKPMRGIPEYNGADDEFLFPVLQYDNEDLPLVAYRSIEYMGNVSPQVFDEDVCGLYRMFDVDYGPSTKAQKEFVAMASGPL